VNEWKLEEIAEAIRQLVELLNVPDNDEWYTVSFLAKRPKRGEYEIDLLSLSARDETTQPSIVISTSRPNEQRREE
jgi:preprotein translocase subunit Sss1